MGLLITISALGMFSRCIQGVQRLYFLVAESGFLFVRSCTIYKGARTNKNNPLITAFVAYRTIATIVVDSMNFVAVVVHFVISTIYVENYETQQIHIIE